MEPRFLGDSLLPTYTLTGYTRLPFSENEQF